MKIYFLLSSLLCITFITLLNGSCMFQHTPDIANLTSKGFVSDDCYQSVIEFTPDPDALGLVKQRESAVSKITTQGEINRIVLQNMVDYCIDNLIKNKGEEASKIYGNMESSKKILRNKLASYLSYGKISYKYFREDNAVVLIHRIYRKGLLERINKITISDELKK